MKDDKGKLQLAMRETRDLNPGEQVFREFGARWWCREDMSISSLVKAVLAYGVDIETSTEDTQGSWKGLQAYTRIRAKLEELDRGTHSGIDDRVDKESWETKTGRSRSDQETVRDGWMSGQGADGGEHKTGSLKWFFANEPIPAGEAQQREAGAESANGATGEAHPDEWEMQLEQEACLPTLSRAIAAATTMKAFHRQIGNTDRRYKLFGRDVRDVLNGRMLCPNVVNAYLHTLCAQSVEPIRFLDTSAMKRLLDLDKEDVSGSVWD